MCWRMTSYFNAVDELQIAQISNPDERLMRVTQRHILYILKQFKNRTTEESSASLSWRCENRVPPEPLWPDPSSRSPSHPDRRSDRPPETCAAPGTDTWEQTAEINQNDSQLKQKCNVVHVCPRGR